MKEYETETGIYVLRDADGRVVAKANVPVGTHLVPDAVDVSRSEDLTGVSELNQYDVDEIYKS